MKHKKFVIIGIIVVLGLAWLGFDNHKSTSHISHDSQSAESLNQDNSKSNESNSDKVFKKSYHVGDTVSYKGVSIKVNKVHLWRGDDDDTPDNGKQYVIPEVTLKNTSKSSQDEDGSQLQLDDNGSKDFWDDDIDSGPYQGHDLGDGSLDAGASRTGDLYSQGKIGDKYQLVYQPPQSNSDDQVIRINLN